MITAGAWILVGSTLLCCVVAALHDALRDYSVVRLRELVERRGRSRMLDRVLDDAPAHALAIGLLRVVCSVAVVLSAMAVCGVFEEPAQASTGLTMGRLSGGLVLACSLLYVFGLLIPMSIADHAGERLIYALATPVRVLCAALWPLRPLWVVDGAIRRLTGAHHLTDGEKLEEEIISVVTEGEREGQLGETQRDMIEAVVDFRSRTVDQIMTPRTEIEGFEYTDDLAFIRRFVVDRGHSRIPVYHGDLDHIVGVLYAKDLIPLLGTDASAFRLKPVLRRPVFVPETKALMELLYELRARKVHMAIVADEYGGTAGLVTFEDLLEEIVGEIQDEYEPQQAGPPEIEVKPDAGAAEAEARAYIIDVNEALEPLGLEVPASEEYDTLGGYVLARLGHIPVAGETFRENGFSVTVLAAEPTRVTRLKIERLELDGNAAPDQPEADAQPDRTTRVAGA